MCLCGNLCLCVWVWPCSHWVHDWCRLMLEARPPKEVRVGEEGIEGECYAVVQGRIECRAQMMWILSECFYMTMSEGAAGGCLYLIPLSTRYTMQWPLQTHPPSFLPSPLFTALWSWYYCALTLLIWLPHPFWTPTSDTPTITPQTSCSWCMWLPDWPLITGHFSIHNMIYSKTRINSWK